MPPRCWRSSPSGGSAAWCSGCRATWTAARGRGRSRRAPSRRNLAGLTDLPIGFWDERLSTVAAERALLEADASRRRRGRGDRPCRRRLHPAGPARPPRSPGARAMTDEVWRREAVESPCIKLCVVDPALAALPRLLPLDRGDRRLVRHERGGAAGGDGRVAGAGGAGEAGPPGRACRAARARVIRASADRFVPRNASGARPAPAWLVHALRAGRSGKMPGVPACCDVACACRGAGRRRPCWRTAGS